MKYWIQSPSLGDLYIEEIFGEIDNSPFLFTVKAGRRLYFAGLESFEEDRYLLAEITYSTLVKMIKGDLTVRNAYLSTDGYIEIVDLGTTVVEKFIPKEKLNYSILPAQGTFLYTKYNKEQLLRKYTPKLVAKNRNIPNKFSDHIFKMFEDRRLNCV